ncbi:MAG: AtpZ/AtpI family protein [Anaerolineaceae bacterium]
MNETDKKAQGRKLLNVTLVAVTGLVGFVTLLIIAGAIFLGMWLDQHFQSQHLYTIICLIVSIPLSLVAMLLIVRAAAARFKTRADDLKKTSEEESTIGKDA